MEIPVVWCRQLKKDHPEWLVSPLSKPGSPHAKDYKKPRHGIWSAMDFSHQEVRDLTVKFIEEVCENYDIDGIDVDFLRFPVYFKKTAWGEDAGQEELDKMTRMMRRIRQVTERVGLKRGRPILIAIRIPDSVGYCKATGLDIIGWLEEELIDIMMVGGYFRLNSWKTSVDLGHKYGVPVYPCLSYSWGMRDRQRRWLDRSRAMNIWNSGADGVYMYNLYDPYDPLLREVGDPKVLETMDKGYVVRAIAANRASGWLRGGEQRFGNIPTLSPKYPVCLKSGETKTVELYVGQHVRENKTKGLVPYVELRLLVEDLPNATDLSVKLNDKQLSNVTKSGKWFQYLVPHTFIKEGENRFEFMLKPGSISKPKIKDLLLWVRYKKKISQSTEKD